MIVDKKTSKTINIVALSIISFLVILFLIFVALPRHSWTTADVRNYDLLYGYSKNGDKEVAKKFGKPYKTKTIKGAKATLKFEFWKNTDLGNKDEVMLAKKNDEVQIIMYGSSKRLNSYIQTAKELQDFYDGQKSERKPIQKYSLHQDVPANQTDDKDASQSSQDNLDRTKKPFDNFYRDQIGLKSQDFEDDGTK